MSNAPLSQDEARVASLLSLRETCALDELDEINWQLANACADIDGKHGRAGLLALARKMCNRPGGRIRHVRSTANYLYSVADVGQFFPASVAKAILSGKPFDLVQLLKKDAAAAKMDGSSIKTILGEKVRVGRVYWLHVGNHEEAFPVGFPRCERASITVAVVGFGDGFVDEETTVCTREEFGIVHRFQIVPPPGRGWERDAEKDKHADDKWSAWRRRRTWALA